MARIRAILARIRVALRADAERQHASYVEWGIGEEGVGARPALPVMQLPLALPIKRAPRDGTMVRLLIDFEGCDTWLPMTDDMQSWTVGFNHFDHDEQDEWIFVGWCWSQDCIVDCRAPGHGKVIGWLPIGSTSSAYPVVRGRS